MDKKEKTGVLNVRDLVNVGLFSVLIFIATFLSGMIGFIPVLMPVVPFVYGIVSGPVYMLYFTKIKKAGMLFIQTIVVTLAFVATGHGPWVLLTAVIGGLLGEVVLRNGRYKSVKHARLAFSVQSIYGLGNWLPIYFARDAYIRQMLDMGYGEEYTQKNDECFAELDASADCDFRNARRVHRLHDRHKNVEETFCKSRHGRGGIACTVKNLNWIFGRKC